MAEGLSKAGIVFLKHQNRCQQAQKKRPQAALQIQIQ
jgi:hypothetical protein